MRSFVYGIAVLAAAGLAFTIATSTNDSTTASQSAIGSNTPASTAAVATESNAFPESGTLVLSVPDMMCEFSCFPKIKKTLEASQSVNEVELAKQKEAGTVDNRQVIVKYDAGFKVNDAIEMLKAEGFDNAEVVQ